MLSKEKLDRLMTILGDLTKEQKAILTEIVEKPMSERSLFEKLGGVDEGKFGEFMKAVAAEQENEVLEQELSPDEMEAAAGGDDFTKDGCDACALYCSKYHYRPIYAGCAATVEDGSLCNTNDACWSMAVQYSEMKDCQKAWH